MKKKTKRKIAGHKTAHKTKRAIAEDSCGGPCEVVNGNLCEDCAEWGGLLSGNTMLSLEYEQKTNESDDKTLGLFKGPLTKKTYSI
ncbi:MAG: hypothetical protein GY847_21035 [Proteobacteria bacterium]|nr:hypothetical protein [Pseudomonadota bacterium]